MKKKVLLPLILLSLSFTMVSCSKDKGTASNAEPPTEVSSEEASQDEDDSSSKDSTTPFGKNFTTISDMSLEGSGSNNFKKIIKNNNSYVAYGLSTSTDGDFKGLDMKEHLNCYFLYKFDAQGKKEWIKSFPMFKGLDISDILEVEDGNMLVVGSVMEPTNKDAGIEDVTNITDGIILKINPKGEIIFKSILHGNLADAISNVVMLKNGNYVVYGKTSSTNKDFFKGNTNNGNIFLMGFDKAGKQTFETYLSSGSLAHTLTACGDGGFAISVNTQNKNGGLMPDKNEKDTYLIVSKFNEKGVQEWSKSYGGGNETPHDMISDDKGIIISASTDTGNVSGKALGKGNLFLKLDFKGNVIFDTVLDTPNSSFKSLAFDKDGNFYASGSLSSENEKFPGSSSSGLKSSIAKFNSSGEFIIGESLENSYFSANSMLLTDNNELFLAGHSDGTKLFKLKENKKDTP